jgi:putative membrane protein
MRLTDSDKARLRDAIQAVEAKSRAEVVLAIRARSASYDRGPVLLGALAAWLFLGFQLFSAWEFPLDAIFLEPPLLGACTAFLAASLPPLERGLASRKRRREAVERAARAMFQERGVSLTRERTGVLVYISMLERSSFLVADKGVSDIVPPETLSQATARIDAAVRAGTATALAAAISGLGESLAADLPARPNDVDELPNLEVHT